MNFNVAAVNPSSVSVSTRNLVANAIAPLQSMEGHVGSYLGKLVERNGIKTLPSGYFLMLLSEQYPEIAEKCAMANKNINNIYGNLSKAPSGYINDVAKSIVKDNNLPRRLDINLEWNIDKQIQIAGDLLSQISKMDDATAERCTRALERYAI